MIKPLSDDDLDRILAVLCDNPIQIGDGEIRFNDDIRYQGQMKDGRCHGKGSIVFPNGVVNSTWINGRAIDASFTFNDGLDFVDSEDWEYCSAKDQRFQSEIVSKEPLSDPVRLCNGELKLIPKSTYDVGNGYYDPVNGSLYDYDGGFIKTASEDHRRWIQENCARSPLAVCRLQSTTNGK